MDLFGDCLQYRLLGNIRPDAAGDKARMICGLLDYCYAVIRMTVIRMTVILMNGDKGEGYQAISDALPFKSYHSRYIHHSVA